MAIQQQKSWKILLIGDSCQDIYHYGVCERMSPEAPVPVFKETNQDIRMGMSTNVKLNLESFDIEVEHWHNSEEIKKHRFIEDRYNQQLFRHDEGETIKIEPFRPSISEEYDAVVISDYDKGYLTEQAFSQLQSQLNPLTPIFVDSKKKDLRVFKNCIVKINESEATRAITDQTQEVVVTLGPKGARWKDEVFETDKVDVFDVCGAGDVFLSALVYGYLTYRDLPWAIILANKCAALSVTKMGTYVLTKKDINGLSI